MDNTAILIRFDPEIAQLVHSILSQTIHHGQNGDYNASGVTRSQKDIFGISTHPTLRTIWNVSPSADENELEEDSLYELLPSHVVKPSPAPSKKKKRSGIQYKRIQENKYLVRIGTRDFYGLMVTLPTTAEVHRLSHVDTDPDHELVSLARIDRMLIVKQTLEDVAVVMRDIDNRGRWIHGITASMQHVLPKRFDPVSPQQIREKNGIELSEVIQAESELNEFRNIFTTKDVYENGRVKEYRPRIFTKKELVQVPGWMSHLHKNRNDPYEFTIQIDPESKTSLDDGIYELMKQAHGNMIREEERLKAIERAGQNAPSAADAYHSYRQAIKIRG